MIELAEEQQALARARAGQRWWPRYALAAVVVVAIASFYLSGLGEYLSWESVRRNVDVWQARVAANLLTAVLVFFVAYTLITALSLPAAAAMTLLAGALFGRWLGTVTVSAASTLGATLAFLGSRYLFRDWVQGRYSERLRTINEGIDRDGAFYLFMLRLVPLVPFFLINLGMGLTRIRVGTYVLTSWVGMLLGTFLYVNAGTAIATIDSPRDVLSPAVLVSLAALGLVPLAIRKLFQWRIRGQTVALVAGLLLVMAIAAVAVRTYLRYRVAETMPIANREYSNAEYPDDPSGRSVHHGQYNGRKLRLVRTDVAHFDLFLEPDDPHVARVVFRDIDASLMTPNIPDWTRDDRDLVRIALTDRQWNRQQVRFEIPSPHVEITGGDGFETESLYSAELAKNCLNAGLWEVLLFAKEGDGKALYYQTWFTFPLGLYKEIFEHNTKLPYWKHWYYLEHWFDPAGTPVPLEKLRKVTDEREVKARYDPAERILFAGEQIRKRRTTMAENVVTWGDFFGPKQVRFATFVPPGKYTLDVPWKNQYWRMDEFQKAILRKVVSPADSRSRDELELVFASSRTAEACRFIVSGFELDELPQLAVDAYPKGLYMPMGIGVPPFYQTYDALQQAPPEASPYFSIMLGAEQRWIDHHSLAVDGPVMHRDAENPGLLHLYLLSYERHSLVSHIVISTD